jgi:hypothetical protein
LTIFAAVHSAACQPVQSGHYFMVIDHSGSMLQKIRSGNDAGRSRWEVMRERAAAFVGRLPDSSFVWAGIFSARAPGGRFDSEDPYSGWLVPFSSQLSSPESRDEFMAKLKSFPEPALANGTWLHQATWEALEKVAMVGQRDPEAYMTVMVYTDGVDQGHGRTSAEMTRNPASACSREDLQLRIKQLQKSHRNFNIVNVYSPGDESILDAHVVRLRTNRFHLASPLVQPQQSVDVELQFIEDPNLQLSGAPIEVEWLPANNNTAGPQVEILSGPLSITNGKIPVSFKVNSRIPEGKDLHAILKLKYPKSEKFFLVEEGGSRVDFHFQGAKAPEIRDLIPTDGSAFPAGRKIGFSLTTLPGCETEWSFPDGTILKGNPVDYALEAPGKKQVTVKVTDRQTGMSASANVTLILSELQIRLDPTPNQVLPGQEVRLRASTQGEFRSVEWQVGERVYTGRPRTDGVTGSELGITFERPGPVTIRAWGDGQVGGRAETETVQFKVTEVPAIRLTAPADGEVLYFGSKRELRAEVEGVEVNQLRFTLNVDGAPPGPSSTVDVRREGSVRSAVFPMNIPDLPQKSNAKLRVETFGVQPPLSREISVRLEGEPASLQLVLPEGREPHIHRESAIRLESNVKLRNIRWDFGEGWQTGGEIERHVWNAYGNHHIKAMATAPDGSELVAAPLEIHIPLRPVRLDASVIYKGRKVGADVSKVPVNATLDLRATMEGDVVGTRWLLDGVELPAGQETVTVRERGFKTLEFVADATAEAGGKGAVSAKVEFRTSDKIVFWASVGAVFGLMALLARLLLGNQWRFAEFHVGKKESGSYSDGGTLKMPWRISSWWTKTAEILMQNLDKKTCPQWRADTRLKFQGGRDPKLLPLGSEWNQQPLSPAQTKELARGYFKRWRFSRLPLIKRQPDHECRMGTLNIVIPALKPGIIGRWPEFLLFFLVACAIAAVRMLHEWLY